MDHRLEPPALTVASRAGVPPRVLHVALAVLGVALAAVYVGAAATMPPGHAALAAGELSIGVAELVWVALVFAPRTHRVGLWAGAVLQGLLALGWVASRTAGLPGQGVLPVGELDVLCLIDGVLTLALALGALAGSRLWLRWPLAPSQLAVMLASMTLFAWFGGHAHGAAAAGLSGSAWAAGGHHHFYCRLL